QTYGLRKLPYRVQDVLAQQDFQLEIQDMLSVEILEVLLAPIQTRFLDTMQQQIHGVLRQTSPVPFDMVAVEKQLITLVMFSVAQMVQLIRQHFSPIYGNIIQHLTAGFK